MGRRDVYEIITYAAVESSQLSEAERPFNFKL